MVFIHVHVIALPLLFVLVAIIAATDTNNKEIISLQVLCTVEYNIRGQTKNLEWFNHSLKSYVPINPLACKPA